jgi:hypothetical protein
VPPDSQNLQSNFIVLFYSLIPLLSKIICPVFLVSPLIEN